MPVSRSHLTRRSACSTGSGSSATPSSSASAIARRPASGVRRSWLTQATSSRRDGLQRPFAVARLGQRPAPCRQFGRAASAARAVSRGRPAGGPGPGASSATAAWTARLSRAKPAAAAPAAERRPARRRRGRRPPVRTGAVIGSSIAVTPPSTRADRGRRAGEHHRGQHASLRPSAGAAARSAARQPPRPTHAQSRAVSTMSSVWSSRLLQPVADAPHGLDRAAGWRDRPRSSRAAGARARSPSTGRRTSSPRPARISCSRVKAAPGWAIRKASRSSSRTVSASSRAVAGRPAGGAVDGDRARRVSSRPGCRLGCGPAQHRLDPQHQLARRERLGDVVVGADLEAGDAVLVLAERGQHDHRQIRVARRGPAADLQAVDLRAASGRARSGPAGRRPRHPAAPARPSTMLGLVAGALKVARRRPRRRCRRRRRPARRPRHQA